MKNILRTALVALALISFGFSNLYSKGGGGFSSGGGRSGSISSGGGSKSWGSSPSSSKSYSSSGSSSSKSTTSSSTWGSASSNKSSSTSSASSSLAQKQAATPVKPRTEYIADFKAKNANTYTNKFAAEPTTRPSYIPQTTVVDGKSYNITYNSGFGGYGYFNALGTFILFDAVTHAATMSYQRDLAYYNTPVVVATSHGFFFYFFIGLLGLVCMLLLLLICV